MAFDKFALGVVAGLECCGNILSKIESLSLDKLEFARLCPLDLS